MGRGGLPAAAPPERLADTGEPVDVPPPLIEPVFVGFEEEASAPDDVPPPEAPPPVAEPIAIVAGEPVAAPASAPLARLTARLAARPVANTVTNTAVERAAEPVAEPKPKRARAQVPARLLALAQQWRVGAQPWLDDRRRLYGGLGAVAAAIVIITVYLAGVGPFHRPAPGSIAPLANAPNDPAQRLGYFQRGANAGDAEAELQLAILYAKGEGVTQDYPTAAKWFRAAAEEGLPRAQYDLGVLYERGRGVTADPVQAAYWYRKSAEGNYPLAQYNLAVAYTKGEGTRKDPTEAALWYRRAAGQGVVQAMVNLGMLYERGEGVPVSFVDAYAWYLAAGQRGNEPAARRAEDLFGALSQLDQVRAQVLARDIAGSIHDPAKT